MSPAKRSAHKPNPRKRGPLGKAMAEAGLPVSRLSDDLGIGERTAWRWVFAKKVSPQGAYRGLLQVWCERNLPGFKLERHLA